MFSTNALVDEDELEDPLEAEAALPRIKDETVEGIIMEAESLEVESLEGFAEETPLMKCPRCDDVDEPFHLLQPSILKQPLDSRLTSDLLSSS